MIRQGSIFQTSSDTEVLAHLIKRSGFLSLKDQLKNALTMLKGAYAFLLMTESELMVALDPNGLRPLSIGRIGDAYCVASETCAFDIIGAEFIRDVLPGSSLLLTIMVFALNHLRILPQVLFVQWNMYISHDRIAISTESMFTQLGKEWGNNWQ